MYNPHRHIHRQNMIGLLNNAISDIRERGKHKESIWRPTSSDVMSCRLFINSLHNVTCGRSLDQADLKLPLCFNTMRDASCLFRPQIMTSSEHLMPFTVHHSASHEPKLCICVCVNTDWLCWEFVSFTQKKKKKSDHNKAPCRYTSQSREERWAAGQVAGSLIYTGEIGRDCL